MKLIRQDTRILPPEEPPVPHTDGTRPILFRDTFGTAADYTKGVFYEGRLRYLREENSLQAPSEFMTRQKQRKVLKLQRYGVQQMQKLDFAKKTEADEINGMKALQLRKMDGQSKKSNKRTNIVVQKYSSTRPSDWSEEVEAGCKFWINHHTGEVSKECPWLDNVGEQENTSSVMEDNDDAVGAGSLVYDDTELQNLFAILDSAASNGSKKTGKK